jgi:Putative transposase of IS4/5 family (DUF4096)
MSDLYWLTDEQMARLEPLFPKSHGRPRVDDRRVLSGIIFVNRSGLRWRDAPREYPTRRQPDIVNSARLAQTSRFPTRAIESSRSPI